MQFSPCDFGASTSEVMAFWKVSELLAMKCKLGKRIFCLVYEFKALLVLTSIIESVYLVDYDFNSSKKWLEVFFLCLFEVKVVNDDVGFSLGEE